MSLYNVQRHVSNLFNIDQVQLILKAEIFLTGEDLCPYVAIEFNFHLLQFSTPGADHTSAVGGGQILHINVFFPDSDNFSLSIQP